MGCVSEGYKRLDELTDWEWERFVESDPIMIFLKCSPDPTETYKNYPSPNLHTEHKYRR